jgi:hypothetical protein
MLAQTPQCPKGPPHLTEDTDEYDLQFDVAWAYLELARVAALEQQVLVAARADAQA